MTAYSEKLKSPKWQKRRLEILQRDNFTCQICTDTETELQIHHKKYTGEPYEAPEDDLVTMCKCCHKAETYANKNGLNLISAFKKGQNYFGKLSDKSLYIPISFKVNGQQIETEAIIKNPKELSTIINSMF